METLQLRSAARTDTDILRQILTDGSQRKLSYGETVWDTGWTTDEVEAYMQRGTPYLALARSTIVGCAWLQWEDDLWVDYPLDKAGYIHRLVVKENFRGLGLGRQILGLLTDIVIMEGGEAVRLDTPTANTNLCNYYENLGFTRVADIYVPSYGYSEALYERPL